VVVAATPVDRPAWWRPWARAAWRRFNRRVLTGAENLPPISYDGACGLTWRTVEDDGVSLLLPATTHRCGAPEEINTLGHEHHTCSACGATLWTPGLQGAERAAARRESAAGRPHDIEEGV
jgi:hypothetical protein